MKNNNWQFYKADLTDKETLLEIFKKYKPETVIIGSSSRRKVFAKNPDAYIQSNIVDFLIF